MPMSQLLIPVQKYTRRQGAFRWPDRPILATARTADELPLKQLAEDLKGKLRTPARLARNAFGPATLRVARGNDLDGPEAYRLTVAKDGVEIVAGSAAGAYYAVQTLRDLLAVHGRRLPAMVIEDWPDYPRRGVYHDCSRGKVPKLATLKELVERLARWKVNELQLYIKNVFTFVRHPAIGKGYSPLTPEEFLALQDHCRLHHVRLVGSLASFGHMENILALPEYRHLGEMPGYRGLAGGTTLCPGDPGSIKLMAELYEEFLPLFEAEDFNVCCDETWELGKGRSKRRAQRVGVGRVYLDFLKQLRLLCRRHDKRMNAWADIVLEHPDLLGDVPKDIVMLNWDYEPDGGRIPRTREIVEAGLPVVVCPGTNSWASHGCRLQKGMANIARFAAEGLARRAEGLLNTDWGDGGHRNMLAVSLHNLAFGAAHSWNHSRTSARGFGFTERFCRLSLGVADRRTAEAIRTLGRADSVFKANPHAGYIYGTFTTSVAKMVQAEQSSLDDADAAALTRHSRALRQLRWPKPGGVKDRFVARMFREYALASRLDALACRRLALIKQLRDGKSPPAAKWKDLAAETLSVAAELKRIWALGNKPSRLSDQLKAMRRSVGEYRKLARG